MPKTYDRQTAAFLAKVAECMPTIRASLMQGWIENPLLLSQVLNQLCVWNDQVYQNFSCGKSHEEDFLLEELRKKVVLATWGQRLCDTALSDPPMWYGDKVVTVRVKLRQLGFTESVSLRDFKKRALQFGLTECPLFVAYHYRLRYTNQPIGEYLYILTKSIDIGEGEYSLFGLTRHSGDRTGDSGLWLDGHYGQDDFMWNPDSEFVFALKQ